MPRCLVLEAELLDDLVGKLSVIMYVELSDQLSLGVSNGKLSLVPAGPPTEPSQDAQCTS